MSDYKQLIVAGLPNPDLFRMQHEIDLLEGRKVNFIKRKVNRYTESPKNGKKMLNKLGMARNSLPGVIVENMEVIPDRVDTVHRTLSSNISGILETLNIRPIERDEKWPRSPHSPKRFKPPEKKEKTELPILGEIELNKEMKTKKHFFKNPYNRRRILRQKIDKIADFQQNNLTMATMGDQSKLKLINLNECMPEPKEVSIRKRSQPKCQIMIPDDIGPSGNSENIDGIDLPFSPQGRHNAFYNIAFLSHDQKSKILQSKHRRTRSIEMETSHYNSSLTPISDGKGSISMLDKGKTYMNLSMIDQNHSPTALQDLMFFKKKKFKRNKIKYALRFKNLQSSIQTPSKPQTLIPVNEGIKVLRESQKFYEGYKNTFEKEAPAKIEKKKKFKSEILGQQIKKPF